MDAMIGLASDYSVSALSGRCPRILVRDRAVSPFPATPRRTVHQVRPYPPSLRGVPALPRTFARPRSACSASVPRRARFGSTPSPSNSTAIFHPLLRWRRLPLGWLRARFRATRSTPNWSSFAFRAGALSVAEGMLPPRPIPPPPPLALPRLPAPTARGTDPLADGRAKLPTRLLTRPTQHPTALSLAPGQPHAAMVEPQELKAFLAVVHPPRLLRVPRQPDAGPRLPRPFPGARRLFGRAARDDEVLRVAGQPPEEGLLGLRRRIETVPVAVSQQGGQDPALRAPRVGIVIDPVQQVARLQPAGDEPQQFPVTDPAPQCRHPLLVIQPVEARLDVGVYHPPEPRARGLVDGFPGSQRPFLRPEPEGGAFTVRLADRLQEPLGGRLHHAIPHRGNTEGPRPRGIPRFGDLHPPHRLGSVGLVPQALRDLRPTCRHPLGFDVNQRLRADPSGTFILAHQLPGTRQEVRHRQPILQGVEAALRIARRGWVELRWEPERSVFGGISRFDTHQTVLLSLHGPAAGPSLDGRGVVSRLQTGLCPA